jgi:peptidoglycan-N-acetylglucosamine deacetylase
VADRGADERPVLSRLIVRTVAGRSLGATPWVAGGGARDLSPALAGAGRTGVVMVSAQARDAAGNRGDSAGVAVGLPGPPGPARRITRVATRRPVVALTIDDGYDARAVESMVRTAERMRAPITLCINGSAAASYPAAVRARLRAAASAGWVQACSHGYSHRTGAGTSRPAAYRDLRDSLVWDRVLGHTSVPFYRPPYGAIGPGIRAAATDLGYRYLLLWDVDTNDWRHRSAATTTSHVLRASRRGSIVLLHAIPSSAAALPVMIAGLRARGLEPVGMGDLLAAGRPQG